MDESKTTGSRSVGWPLARCFAGGLTLEDSFPPALPLATFVIRADPSHCTVKRKVVPAVTKTSAAAARPAHARRKRFSRRRSNASAGDAVGTGVLAEGETEILDSDCVNISFPGFFDTLSLAVE
jgi:hypothetical protein